MPKPCDDCGADQKPANDMDCERAKWVCPECAPDFVLANATTFTNVEDPLI